MGFFTKIIFSSLLGLSISLSAKPFVSVELKGQLGNQMFQIATATSLALDNDAVVVCPDLAISNKWNIPTNYKKVFFRVETVRKGSIKSKYFDPLIIFRPIAYKPNMHIEGWFQSEKYFDHHRKEILELFAPSEKIHTYLTTRYADILSHPCTVALHHRCYLKEDPTQTTHPTQTIGYFYKAIAHYPEDALFVVCSNDIDWCKRNFADIPRNFVYIENEPHYHDLFLMSMCKHNIVSNSSFSWWSAYLNVNPDKIITAPKRWFAETSGSDYRDVIPASWISIE